MLACGRCGPVWERSLHSVGRPDVSDENFSRVDAAPNAHARVALAVPSLDTRRDTKGANAGGAQTNKVGGGEKGRGAFLRELRALGSRP